jgi:hypothetical protein
MTKAMSDTKQRPDREGKRSLAAYVDPATLRAVKMLAREQRTTSAAIIHEAIGLVLARHGKPLPQPAIEHLQAHGRPLPIIIRKAKANDLG